VESVGVESVGVESVGVEPVASEPVASEAVPPAVPVRYSAAARPSAVLAGCRRGDRRRSLPRLLIGAGALVVAALVVVALFRPDGPLDPPTDPVARDGAGQQTGAPVGPAPSLTVPVPVVEGVRAEAVPAPVRPTAPVRVRTLTDSAPADLPGDGARSSVVTTPPVVPDAPEAAKGSASGRPVARPVGAAPRVPPTPDTPAA
jgi:hypothetical protein